MSPTPTEDANIPTNTHTLAWKFLTLNLAPEMASHAGALAF